MAKVFTYAGVARQTDGVMVFRATGRKEYAEILVKEGKTDVTFVALPSPLEKDAARAYIAKLPEFGSAEVQALLNGKPVKAPKAAKEPKAAKTKPVKAPKAVKKVEKAVEQSADDIADIKAKNLETMKKVSKSLKKMKDYLPGQVAMVEGDGVEDFDPVRAREEVNEILRSEGYRDSLPKFLRDEVA